MTRTMIVALAVLVALAVSAPLAPPQTPRADPAPPPPVVQRTVEGRVQAVDRATRRIILEDGTRYTVPPAVTVRWREIAPGTTVVVAYVESGRDKAVRRVDVKG